LLGGVLPGTGADGAAVVVVPDVPATLFVPPVVADDDVPGMPGVVDADDAVPGIGAGCVAPVLLVESAPLVDEPLTGGITMPTAADAASGPELDVVVVIAAFFCVDPPVPESVSLVVVVAGAAVPGVVSDETTESLPFTTLSVPNAEPSAPKPA
jgi:hypothetical protein